MLRVGGLNLSYPNSGTLLFGIYRNPSTFLMCPHIQGPHSMKPDPEDLGSYTKYQGRRYVTEFDWFRPRPSALQAGRLHQVDWAAVKELTLSHQTKDMHVYIYIHLYMYVHIYTKEHGLLNCGS